MHLSTSGAQSALLFLTFLSFCVQGAPLARSFCDEEQFTGNDLRRLTCSQLRSSGALLRALFDHVLVLWLGAPLAWGTICAPLTHRGAVCTPLLLSGPPPGTVMRSSSSGAQSALLFLTQELLQVP